MRRNLGLMVTLSTLALACTDDGTAETSTMGSESSGETTETTTAAETSTSQGDGDGDMSGDGDGDPAMGDGDGDMSGDGDGDGDATGDGDGDGTGDGDGDATGDGDGDATGDGDGDMTGDGDGDPQPVFGEWLLTSDQIGDAVRLLRVDISEGQEGQTQVLCEDIQLPEGAPQQRFTSLAFVDNILYAVRSRYLMTVDPCECEAQLVGLFPQGASIAGIAVNEDDLMYAIDAGSNGLYEVNPDDATLSLITSFDFNVGNHGLTWSNAQVNELYFIEATSDTLRTLDGSDPSVELDSSQLSIDFGSVGCEMHPGNEVLYACSSGPELYSVDIETGEVELIAPMEGFDGPCGAIGAPWGPVECIPM